MKCSYEVNVVKESNNSLNYIDMKVKCIVVGAACLPKHYIMNKDFKTTARRFMNMTVDKYRQVIFYAKWAICIAVTLLVWGGAVWFGSLAWDQKQGAILALMGFGAWLVICRFVLPGFWFLSLEIIKRFIQYINYRFL